MTKEQWSIPTWYFMHGFAEKIDSEFYKNNYKECWMNIYVKICNNLPCPICQKHASHYISNTKIYNINTKERLKKYLYNFHNAVNHRLGKKTFEYSKLNKYKNIKLHKTFRLMYTNITMEYYGVKIFNGWRRKKGMVSTLTYMKNIWKYIK
jgi:hypothetical protein